MYVSDAYGGQEMMLNPLVLKLQIVVNHCVGAGNQTFALWKSSQCS